MLKNKAIIDVSKYNSFVFDCDGVVLDSNSIKTNAFYNTVISYGESVANEFVDYHVRNGGISRYEKFRYLLSDILKINFSENLLNELVFKYASIVSAALMLCPVADKLNHIWKLHGDKCWSIVSGGDQNELRAVFKKRQIEGYFTGGIFGSPNRKEEILSREIDRGNIVLPALFFGDSAYDYIAASSSNIDFIFVSEWTDFKGWKEFKEKHDFVETKSLSDFFLNENYR